MSKLELVIVRHGETTANAAGIIQGQTDVPLNEKGIMQAEMARNALRDETFDYAYASDLSRAMVTARRILPDMEVNPSPLLREWDLGNWAGKSIREIKEEDAAAYAGFSRSDPDTLIPGGETRRQVEERVKKFMESLMEKHKEEGGKILLVSHYGVITAIFWYLISGGNPHCAKNPQMTNAAISRFQYENGFWQMISWNEKSHLTKKEGITEERF